MTITNAGTSGRGAASRALTTTGVGADARGRACRARAFHGAETGSHLPGPHVFVNNS